MRLYMYIHVHVHVHVFCRFDVAIIKTGSYYDEAKVGNPDEFDYVAELQPISRDPGVAFEATTDPAYIQIQIQDVDVRLKWKECLCDSSELRQYNEASAM